jgi:lipopolysaccharide cholinephosphotransferase
MDLNNLFPDNREKGDTRLRQSQLVMLRMLKIFDYLCSKHQIKYFLTGGSLLGAIRHKGFIPWDDDLDVGMTRTNYEKFIQNAVPELPADIFFQNRETDPCYPAYHLVEAKLRDKYSSYVRTDEDKIKYNIKWHNGIQLDLFVYDRAFLPYNLSILALNRLIKILGRRNSDKKRAGVLKFISKFSPFPLVYASSFIYNRERMKLGTYKKGKEITDLIRTQFEDMEVSIPRGWHSYLKRQYGNYMQLLPIEQQRGHYGKDLPDPFTPCHHSEILLWKERRMNIQQ